MDLRNLSSTPNQLDIQRRTSLSSLSSTSGYASSGYGGNTNGAGTTNSTTRTTKLHLNEFNGNPTTQNVWINNNNSNSLNDVTPWVEQQKQQQSKVGSLGLEKDKKGSNSPSVLTSPTITSSGAKPVDKQTQSTIHNQNQNDEKDDSDEHDDHDDELIPTAIVIKNIPFAIKKEQLLDVMTKLNLPLPYAFNYHFDNGVFRGLAFANFTSTDETSSVVNQLNGREIGGRKLRVEYKKMLPAQERERIEREKREKRGQLEEQHRSTSNASLASLMSTASTTAATKNLSTAGSASQPERLFLNFPNPAGILNPLPADVNFNDFEVLELFTQLMAFKDDSSKSILELAFPPNLTIGQRKTLSSLCSYLSLLELYDNGLIVIRRKPGHVFQILTPNGGSNNSTNATPASNPTVPTELVANGTGPHSSNSMLNLNQMNNPLHTPTHSHPELLRSHSQSALPLPRLRQQTSTPIQPQFPQYPGNGQSSGSKQLYQGIQPFGFMPSNQPNILPNQLGTGSFNPSSSAAAILRNSSNSTRPSYGDIRSTPPLSNGFPVGQVTESPTPTPQTGHSSLFNGTAPGTTEASVSNANGTTVNNKADSKSSSTSSSNNGSNSNGINGTAKVPSQPSTPLQSNDINSRFAPFGQHSQFSGSLSSLPTTGNPHHSDEFNDLTGKFNSINLNYDTATTSSTGSGIWGPK